MALINSIDFCRVTLEGKGREKVVRITEVERRAYTVRKATLLQTHTADVRIADDFEAACAEASVKAAVDAGALWPTS